MLYKWACLSSVNISYSLADKPLQNFYMGINAILYVFYLMTSQNGNYMCYSSTPQGQINMTSRLKSQSGDFNSLLYSPSQAFKILFPFLPGLWGWCPYQCHKSSPDRNQIVQRISRRLLRAAHPCE